MSDGDGQQTNTATTSSAPWTALQPYITDIASQAKGLYNQGTSYAPFNTVAPFSPATQQGLDMTAARAINGSPLVNSASQSLQNLMQPRTAPGQDTLQNLLGGYSDPGQATQQHFADPNSINPYLDQQFNAAKNPVIDAVNAQAGSAGRTGSGAQQQLLTRNLGDLASNIYSNGYENAANRSLNAANSLSTNAAQQAQTRYGAANALNTNFNQQGNQAIAASTLAPSIAGQDYTNLQNLLNVGGAYDNQAQSQLGDLKARYDYGQNQPFNLLQKYASIFGGLPSGSTSTSTGTQQQPSQSVIPSLLGTGVNLLSSNGSNGASLFSNLLGY